MLETTMESWQNIELKHLFYAYRKAKADCFFERSIGCATSFVEYENNIYSNLQNLLGGLQFNQIDFILSHTLGTPRLIAKKLNITKNSNAPKEGHEFFSDPDRAFERLCASHQLSPEFRLVGNFPVDMHLISALWINLVGHKFDAALSKSAFGSRLRRYRPSAQMPIGSVGEYHIEAIGSFQPYFTPYKRWRSGGMQAIRSELEANRPIVAMSMDLTSYYHQIDPSFVADPRFLKEIGVNLSPWELAFTKSLTNALLQWGQKANEQIRSLGGQADDSYLGGLPIGLSAARLIANVLLFGLDRDIEQSLAPIFYGRYVDDIFLVLRDPGNIGNATSLLSYISSRTKSFPQTPDSNGKIYLTLEGGYQGQTKLVLQQEKQKAFFLQGRSGLDLLDNIESEIRSVSSERRLMPSPEHLESMASARILTAAGSPSEEADTLRRADGLAVRRLGWSIQLRAVETLARDIPAREWKKERARFYEFAHNHILRPDKILDHIDYLPRLLSLAVALTDWTEARRLVDAARSAIQKLKARTTAQPIRLNGIEVGEATQGVWHALDIAVCELSKEAIVRSLRWRSSDGKPFPLTEAALELCEIVGLGSDEAAIFKIALDFREADLAKTPYKDHLRRDAHRKRPTTPFEGNLYGLYVHEGDLRQFLHLSNNAAELSAARVSARCQNQTLEGITSSLLPFLFPTRAYSTQEISLYLPTCIFGNDGKPAKQWARYTRAVRGIWVWSSSADEEAPDRNDGSEEPPSRDVYLGSPRHPQTVLLGISSLLTTQDSWSAAASGSPDTSPQRYERIKTLVNQAINAKPRPTHLLLPEHALPERWINTISGLLHDAGISLIAGLDYHVHGTSQIHSAAVLVLTDDRLGYPAAVQIRQPKVLPAPKEEEELLKLFGRTWPHDLRKEKPVYVHGGFSFGVVVCSELQNVSYRSSFQGNVDCMMVLSWNQDLETFGALVEAASLDVHAHIALVNNRMFGDSRVRSPAKKHHDRDLCRIRGGRNEHIVVVELEIDGLRAFQSRAKRWPNDADLYKPVPEGFSLSPRRRVIPS